MQVARGTDAKVIAARVTNGQQVACIELPAQSGNPGQNGWVPRAALNIGQHRKVGDVGFNIGSPPNPSFSASSSYSSQGGLTYTTVKNLLLSYYNNRAALPVEPIYLRDRLNNEARQAYLADRIAKGINKVSIGLRALLDTGNFDWRDIRSQSRDATSLGRNVGIYLIVHEFGSTPRLPEMYSGSTSDSFQARETKHRGSEGWGATSPTSPHYRAAKQAGSHHYFPICYFDAQDTEKSDLKIAEQIFTDLFQTTCTAVLDLRSFTDINEDTDASAAAVRREMRGAEAQARAAKYVDDKESATVLARNADTVFAVTGWPGGVRRRARPGLKPFGIGAGLNWSMPITEMQFEKQTWIMSSIPGRFANYRRVAFISREDNKRNKGSKVIWQKNTVGKGDSNVAFYLPQGEPGPAYGTKVHVVVEVRLDGRPCGVPWSRQATVGPWSDSADATMVAMRIEWPDEDGNWFFKHLQCDYPNNFATVNKADIAGSTTGYRVATGMKAYFLRQHRPQTQAFPWLYDFGIAEIKEIYFDHLSQTIATRRLTTTTNAATVRALADHEIAKLLLDSGAEKYAHISDPNAAESFKGNTGFPIPPSSVGLNRWNDDSKGGPGRVSCDYCFAMVKRGGRTANHVPCKEFAMTRRCKQCTELKKPCTFTRASRLLNPNNTALLKATYNPQKAHTAVQPLQKARFVHNF